nr:MAG TPA: hypothetical protein [Caudoviricetes sp.]
MVLSLEKVTIFQGHSQIFSRSYSTTPMAFAFIVIQTSYLIKFKK